jgi:hypothetical protein
VTILVCSREFNPRRTTSAVVSALDIRLLRSVKWAECPV